MILCLGVWCGVFGCVWVLLLIWMVIYYLVSGFALVLVC